VFLGSATWWLLLSLIAGAFRARFDTRALRWVNRISGLIITAFGLIALVSLLMAQPAFWRDLPGPVDGDGACRQPDAGDRTLLGLELR
jgi:hypothetical protein